MDKERKLNYNPNSPKFIAAKESLPKELQPIFEQLVDEYCFFAIKYFGKNFAAYNILADLTRNGWRQS